MSGIASIVGDRPMFDPLFLGLFNQGFRGDRFTAVAGIGANGLNTYRSAGSPKTALGKLEFRPSEFDGLIGVAHNGSSPSLVMPVVCDTRLGQIAMVVDGTASVSGLIAQMLTDTGDIVASLSQAVNEIDAPFAAVIMAVINGEETAYCARNNGRKPLCVGTINFAPGEITASHKGVSGHFFASQNQIFSGGGQFIHNIPAGEIAVATASSYQWFIANENADQTRCPCESCHWQRPENDYAGLNVAVARRRCGQALGKLFLTVNPQYRGDGNVVVVQIPDGGKDFGFGVRDETGFPYASDGIIKNGYIDLKPRSDQERLEIYRSKYRVHWDVVKGRKVLLVDDAWRHGWLMPYLAAECFRLGALEVHGMAGSVLRSLCPYENDYLTQIQPPAALLTDDDIASRYGMTTFTSLTPELIRPCLSMDDSRQFCFDCFR